MANYNFYTGVVGNGRVSYIRNGNTITVSAIPDDRNHFFKMVLLDYPLTGYGPLVTQDGDEIIAENGNTLIVTDFTQSGRSPIETPEATFTLTHDSYLIVYFRRYFIVSAHAEPDITMVHVSKTLVYEGDYVDFITRPVTSYHFNGWSDGSLDFNHRVYPKTDLILVARYSRDVKETYNYPWYCYIKDKENLNTPPKAYLRVKSFRVAEDLLTTSNSSVEVQDITDDVNTGDILCLINPYGLVKYSGVIKSTSLKEIQLNQMQSFYKGEYLIDMDRNYTAQIPSGQSQGDVSWKSEIYYTGEKLSKILTFTQPTPSSFEDIEPDWVGTVEDQNMAIGDSSQGEFCCKMTTYVYSSIYYPDAVLTVEVKGAGSFTWNDRTTLLSEESPTSISSNIKQGWNECIICIYVPTSGITYGANLSVRFSTVFQYQQSQGSFAPISIETQFSRMLKKYADGYSKGSFSFDRATGQEKDIYDHLMRQEKAPIKIKTGSSTEGKLVFPGDNETTDMETYIYSLYEKYQILLNFNVPFGSWNIGDDNGGSVTLLKPDYPVIKVSDNANCIIDVEPTNELKETNKLIVYTSDGKYRKTFYSTVDGIKDETYVSTIGRVGDIQTKIVFSDDAFIDIIKANLNEEMYNHKITFTLMLDNNLYSMDDFKLGTPVEIYKDGNFYKSIITGYEMQKNEDQDVISAKYTCGLVRTNLTKKLSRKLGVI